jgi:thiaminase/transcriptional activator TenA
MSFCEQTVSRHAELWKAATRHRFTEELADDALDEAVFRRYLIQDFAFIHALAGLIGFAVGRAPSYDAKKRLAGFLGVITGDETSYFERSMAALGIDAATRDAPPEGRVAAALRAEFEAASETSYADILSVFVPAEWVYLDWASYAAARGKTPSRFYYAEWIELHSVEPFRAFVGWLRAELDREAALLDAAGQARLANRFGRLLELEVAFFDDVYREESPSGS